ncbi:hypothetical protein GCM10023336_11730 [Streptomyces similanensis]|uniref:Uncharacterized protein n=1 Tax=Streptomyces similanensis TaxID=1274988 RepID=A0ABP9JX79_9ACTN
MDKEVPPGAYGTGGGAGCGGAVRLRGLPSGFRPDDGAPWREAGKSGDSRWSRGAEANRFTPAPARRPAGHPVRPLGAVTRPA